MNIEEIVNDFSRRYGDTYVLVQMPGEDEKNVFHVDRIIPDEDHGAVLQLSSNEFGSIKLNMSTGHSIFFEYPKVGSFQNGKEAALFRRVPARQYRRGLCNGNAGFFRPTESVMGLRALEWDWNIVNNAYKCEKYGLQEALKMLASGKYRSVALKDGFSVSLSLSTGKDYLIFYCDLPVGRINPTTGEIVVTESSFASEIQELG